MADLFSPLQKFLMQQSIPLASCCSDVAKVSFVMKETCKIDPKISARFPHLQNRGVCVARLAEPRACSALRLGVVFSGGQAPGGHNVIAGIFDAMQKMSPASVLIGFEGGPLGMMQGRYKEITQKLLEGYRNSGGFDLLGSGRTKIETQEQLSQSLAVFTELKLDGIVVIGGDDSNTNACALAEYILSRGSKMSVIGVPKTIDGDLQNQYVQLPFGFDTATKVFSELIGNIAVDARSSQKYYHFIKLMGRSASWVTLECSLATQVNLALIAEEIKENNMSLTQVVELIAELIQERASIGKNYGIILIPEGLIEFIPEFTKLIDELNTITAENNEVPLTYLKGKLSFDSWQVFQQLPAAIQQQLLMDRDPHGNVQLSHIETEKMLSAMVGSLLEKRKIAGSYSSKFFVMHHFFGYEGRSAFPSLFDACYAYNLGYCAALMAECKLTGYMAFIQGLNFDVQSWTFGAVPLESLMAIEKRKGIDKPVIKKALIDTKSPFYAQYKEKRELWRRADCYLSLGPMQLAAPSLLSWQVPLLIADARRSLWKI